MSVYFEPGLSVGYRKDKKTLCSKTLAPVFKNSGSVGRRDTLRHQGVAASLGSVHKFSTRTTLDIRSEESTYLRRLRKGLDASKRKTADEGSRMEGRKSIKMESTDMLTLYTYSNERNSMCHPATV